MSDLNIPSESLSPARARRLPLNRLNLALAVVLVIQTALAVVVYWPRTTSGGGEALLPDVTAEEVTSLRIADAEGNEVVLERGEEGWTLAGTDGYPANEEKINTSLDKLLALNGDRLVTQTAASHKQLQVAEDDFVRRITLNAGGDEYTLYLGSSAGAGATHLRLAGNDATYLTSEVATWELETSPTSWVTTQYFTVPADEIQEMTLTNAHGTFTFTRGEGDSWTMEGLAEGETLQESAVTGLVNRVASINLVKPLGKTEDAAYGLAQPQATITLRTQPAEGEETAYTLLVGAKLEEDNSYYFKASSSPFYVTIASFTGDDFVNKQRSDFIAPPPTPEASTTPAASEAGGEPAPAAAPVSPLATPVAETAPLTATKTITATETATATETITAAESATATETVTGAEAIVTPEPEAAGSITETITPTQTVDD